MKKAATVSLSKYNVPIKERAKVTSKQSSSTEQYTVLHVTKYTTKDGALHEAKTAPDSDVVRVARKVISTHGEVIKRLAKR